MLDGCLLAATEQETQLNDCLPAYLLHSSQNESPSQLEWCSDRHISLLKFYLFI